MIMPINDSRSSATTDDAGAAPGGTVLCLDDDPISLKLLYYLLKKRFEVYTCSSIEEAVELARTSRVSHFICDYHLASDFTGSKALRTLKREPGFEPETCVLITGDPSPEVDEDARQAGFNRLFTKPLRADFREFFQGLSNAFS